jgi:hypothetical protein
LSKNRLYIFLLAIALGGYLWLGYSLYADANHDTVSVCMFKTVTGYPCPSCGTTRAAVRFLEGDFWVSLLINPLGLLALIILLIVPFWILFDGINAKSTFYNFYLKSEIFLTKKWNARMAILIILFIWIWNIYKEL